MSEQTNRDWTIGDVPEWGPACLDDLVEGLLSTESPFPCTFAVAGAKKRTLRFGFVDDLEDAGTWSNLTAVVLEYLRTYRSISRDTSLIVFFRPERRVRTIEEYHAKFWQVMRYLHEHDPRHWPAEVPTDPEHPMWEFSYGGTSIFVVCNTPAHTRRRSRYSPGFVITFQPRWVFDGLEPDSARGSAARRVIRKRLRAFDGTPPSQALGNYGDPDNREWRQYFLTDRNTDAELGCPFRADAAGAAAGVASVAAGVAGVAAGAAGVAAGAAGVAAGAAGVAAGEPVGAPAAPPTCPVGGMGERRRALHRRLVAEAGLASVRPTGHRSGARGSRERASRSLAAAHRVWLARETEPTAGVAQVRG